MESLVTIEEVAKYLKVTPRAVYNWIHEYQLPHYKVGRCLRFEMNEIKEWLKTRRG